MTGMDEIGESQATALCRACGLCCTGHLFIWAKLRPRELDPAEALGMTVFRSDPTQRGFSMPCPLWKGQCTIHDTPRYPHVCRAYRCKLLKELSSENIALPEALTTVEQAKVMIRELEALLPGSRNITFRERLVAHLKRLKASGGREDKDLEFVQKAEALLAVYEKVFGVNDVIEQLDEE